MQLFGDASQSALHPAGRGAEKIAELFFWMVGGGTVIWILVIGLAVYAILSPAEHSPRWTKRLVIGGGAIVPTIVLSGLLVYALAMLPELQRPAPQGSRTIEVAGVRWWWRVVYLLPDGRRVETANQIRVPVNEAVEFRLLTEDVIHSFWIPSLGGKVDMIPGRVNRLKLHSTVEGVYRGACAEFCGPAHAQMNFDVLVLSADQFEEWLERESQPANEPTGALAIGGKRAFFRQGCSACHTVRGTEADGKVGPDLTHFGSRISIGAGVLRNTQENLMRWIAETHLVKPGVQMPPFPSLRDAATEASSVAALAAYLEQLK